MRAIPLLAVAVLMAGGGAWLAGGRDRAGVRALVESAPAAVAAFYEDGPSGDGARSGSEASAGGQGGDSPAPGDGFYMYVEPSGSVRFVQSLEHVPAHLRSKAKPVKASRDRVKQYRAPPVRRPSRVAPATVVPTPRPQPEVVIYTAQWCPWCRKALAWLDANGVRYTNKDIDVARYKEELIRKTGSSGIPYLEIGDARIRGYSVARMQAALR